MIEKIIDMLDGLNGAELERLQPARRQKLAALCHHWWRLAEGPPTPGPANRPGEQKAGVLSDLRRDHRGE